MEFNQIGSGMPRILKAYPKESYVFGSMFIRAVFPISQKALEFERGNETTPKTTEKKTTEKKLRNKNYGKKTALLPTNYPETTEKTSGKVSGKTSGKTSGMAEEIRKKYGGYWELVENKNG